MKKFLLPIAAMLLCMTACNKDNESILKLEVEQYTSDAKVHLDSENYAVWDNNDAVWVNGAILAVSVSGTSATLADVAESTTGYTALYPADWSNTTGTALIYPEEQTYRTNGSAQVIDAPMAAYSDGSTLKFHNLGAILAVNVTGISRVETIKVVADGTTAINGTCTISDITTGSPSLGAPTSGTNTTTLECNGVTVPSDGMTFYIALPTVEAKLTITIDDGYFRYSKTQGNAMSFATNHGYNVPFDASTATVDQYAPLPNQIWYTATTNLVEKITTVGYGANYVSSSYTDAFTTAIITFDGPISMIPNGAFYGLNTAEKGILTSITLPANVTTVSLGAFSYCEGLTSAIMPGVTAIGIDAFSFCEALTTVSMPSVLNIGQEAFTHTGITSLTLPNLISMDENAFRKCPSLTSVALPKATTIGEGAFEECELLESVSIPNVTQIGELGFNGCIGLTTVYADKLSTIGSAAFQGCTSIAHFYSTTAAPTMTGSNHFSSIPNTAVLYLPASCDGSADWGSWPGTISYDYVP